MPTEPRPVACAPIFAPPSFAVARARSRGSGASAQIEPEIAFVLARDLPARSTPYDEEEVRDAVKEAHFVLEILGSRYAEFGSPALTAVENLADSIANQGLFVGPCRAPAVDAPAGDVPDHRHDAEGSPRHS